MTTQNFHIAHIPATLWGKPAQKVYLFVHGKQGSKADAAAFAAEAVLCGFQVLSFDLPEHGDRKSLHTPCDVQNSTQDLRTIYAYAEKHWQAISLYACSIGAYFSLLAYRDSALQHCLFHSPILNMERLIQNMMQWSGVTEAQLQEKGQIPTDFGETLDWDYYCYVKTHPVEQWNVPTAILYGSKDHLTEQVVLDAFVKAHACRLTVMENGEHWFHTKEQLAFAEHWMHNELNR